jgi:hypothetical protein
MPTTGDTLTFDEASGSWVYTPARDRMLCDLWLYLERGPASADALTDNDDAKRSAVGRGGGGNRGRKRRRLRSAHVRLPTSLACGSRGKSVGAAVAAGTQVSVSFWQPALQAKLFAGLEEEVTAEEAARSSSGQGGLRRPW